MDDENKDYAIAMRVAHGPSKAPRRKRERQVSKSADLFGKDENKESNPKKRERQATGKTDIFEEGDEDVITSDEHGDKGNLGWGRGIIQDWNQTVGSNWRGEMTNFNSKTIPVTFFMFFAAVAPAITFGAVYEKSTGHWIGAVEMIAATAWVGIVYSLIGGQPIMINGGTGPVLAFSAVLYKLSDTIDVPFLTLSAWVGLWVAALNVVAAFANLNRFILYATRFTDEIFALLISVIFIVNALGNPFSPVGLYYYFDKDHKSHDKNENDEGYSYISTGLLSLILALGTTSLAMMLKTMKFSRFFCSDFTRSIISDFSVTIAIFSFIVVDHVLFPTIETESLNVPDIFEPTYACCTADCRTYWPDECTDIEAPYGRRGWLVDLTDLNGKVWVPIFAVIPALLAFILVFLDDGITLHLINHPSHKLTHGDAYNLNTLVIGLMVGVNALLGFPWLVAATVRSLAHLHALADKDKNGKIETVYETRLTNLFVHSLILCSIFVLPWLKLIPVPVLYGVFLYMGVSSLNSNQFYGRLQMFFMQPSRFPDTPYTKHTDTNTMRLYTGIQLFFFLLLYVVKSIKMIAIAFPVVIAICIPVRLYILPKFMTHSELVLLDGDDDEIKKYIRLHQLDEDEDENGV